MTRSGCFGVRRPVGCASADLLGRLRLSCRVVLSGAVYIEMVFQWPGVGRMLVEDPNDEVALANAPQKELFADYAAFNEALAKAGEGFAAGERLQAIEDGIPVAHRRANHR